MFKVLGKSEFPCPVCGYGLDKPAADFTICPSCGVEFGYSDMGITYTELRQEWMEFGAHWSSEIVSPPPNWNGYLQMVEAGIKFSPPFMRVITVTETHRLVPSDTFTVNSFEGFKVTACAS